jgi:spore germination cell wall hydrolase CwlJ-like protein
MKNEEAKEVAKKVSADILSEPTEPSFGNILYFHTTSSSPYWANDMEKVLTCGNHIFYTETVNHHSQTASNL